MFFNSSLPSNDIYNSLLFGGFLMVLSVILYNVYGRGGEPFQRRVPIFRHLNAQNIWRAKTKK